jgi:SHS2 domain-containing protein
MKYKFLPHTADMKFQAYGLSLEKAFANSVLAMQEIITKGIKINPKIRKIVKIKADDLSGLLYKFLEEFLFLLDSRAFIASKISKIKINKEKFELHAVILGDKAKKYKLSNDVKAVTYNNMFVKKEKGKWACQVVLDV